MAKISNVNNEKDFVCLCNVLHIVKYGFDINDQGLIDRCLLYIEDIRSINIWLYVCLRCDYFDHNHIKLKQLLKEKLFDNKSQVPAKIAKLLTKNGFDLFRKELFKALGGHSQKLIDIHVRIYLYNLFFFFEKSKFVS